MLTSRPASGRWSATPIRDAADLARLRPLTPDDVPYITEAVRLLVAELGAKPLIGFAGGPFTLASYLVEGGPSKNHDRTKALMYGNPELWHALMGRLADIAIAFLKSPGRRRVPPAIQLFDSWVGAVSPEDYRHAILPHTTPHLRRAGRLRGAADPLRGRNRRAAGTARGRGRRRGWRGLAGPAG